MMPSAFSPQVSVQKLPHLAVTLGDPAGIGPEVVLKALADSDITHNCQITVVGSRDLLQDTYRKLAAGKLTKPLADPENLRILDVPVVGKIISVAGDAASGTASFVWMEAAIKSTLAGEFHGIVTGPIAKSCWQTAGHHYPGQTELLAERAKVQRFGMLFVAKSPHSGWTFRTLLATTHIPLRQVPETLNPDLLTAKLDLLIECLRQDFRIPNPRIAIAGLNPHSGEGGQLGTEERDWLIPWLQQMQRRHPGIQLDGPVPPDTLWVKAGQAWYDPKTTAHDAYLAMYHDQGLIPVKLLAFDAAVNTTIGLPFIRTSPDHGTAFDIAGKGVANPASMKAAIKLAAELAPSRFVVGLQPHLGL